MFQSHNNAAKRRKFADPRLLDGTYFRIVKRDGFKIEAICTACGLARKGFLTSTGNFMDHLKKSHPSLVGKAENYRKYGKVPNSKQDKKQTTLNDLRKNFTHDEVCILIDTCLNHRQIRISF